MISFSDKYVATILVIDDMKVDLILLSKILYEYNVITADNGISALEIANREIPDFILLDIFMPDMDGYEVCKRLKSKERTKNIPVLFASSSTDEESIEKAYNVGGIDYVTKPFKSKELLARVKTQLAYINMQKELEEKIKLIDKNVSYSSTDVNGIIIEVSDAFCKISGYTKDELIGSNHNILRHSDVDEEVYSKLWTTIEEGESWRGEIKNKKKNGLCFWADVVITPIFDKEGKIIKYMAIRHDISDQKRVEILSITDPLTNLYNRRYFNDILPIEIKRSIRNSSHFTFVMMDVDFFKQYNDTYGHQAGDNALARIGEALQHSLSRAEDLIFRLGGEEFGMIYTGSDSERSQEIVENIRKAIMKLDIEHKKSKVFKSLTISVGLVCVDFSKESNRNLDEDEIYKLADDELYKAKDSGRNRVSLVSI